MRLILIIATLGLGIAASAEDSLSTLHAELQGLDLVTPESDAARDVSQGHPHCYSVNGYGRSFPGASTTKEQAYCAAIEKNFTGTSDVVQNEEHRRLIELAEMYAKRYNAYVLGHRK